MLLATAAAAVADGGAAAARAALLPSVGRAAASLGGSFSAVHCRGRQSDAAAPKLGHKGPPGARMTSRKIHSKPPVSIPSSERMYAAVALVPERPFRGSSSIEARKTLLAGSVIHCTSVSGRGFAPAVSSGAGGTLADACSCNSGHASLEVVAGA